MSALIYMWLSGFCLGMVVMRLIVKLRERGAK